MKIFILTKNITAEQKLQERLQYLGHEVFCTQQKGSDFDNPLYTRGLFNIFQSVVISETISQRDSSEIANFYKEKNYDISLLRKVEQIHEDIEDEDIECLHLEASIEELREKFQDRIKVLNKFDHFDPIKNLFFNGIDIDRLNFSKNERKVIEVLYESPEKCITLPTLCEYLWSAGATNSNLSQLSVLIKKIKGKCKRVDISDNAIESLWGQGYIIDSQFYSFLSEINYFEKAK